MWVTYVVDAPKVQALTLNGSLDKGPTAPSELIKLITWLKRVDRLACKSEFLEVFDSSGAHRLLDREQFAHGITRDVLDAYEDLILDKIDLAVEITLKD